LTQIDQQKIKKLLNLADICQEMEFVELKLSDAWCSLREEFGLSKTLLMIQAYVKTQTPKGAAQSQTPEVGNTHESPSLVQ
jgi:hypothetical protein